MATNARFCQGSEHRKTEDKHIAYEDYDWDDIPQSWVEGLACPDGLLLQEARDDEHEADEEHENIDQECAFFLNLNLNLQQQVLTEGVESLDCPSRWNYATVQAELCYHDSSM